MKIYQLNVIILMIFIIINIVVTAATTNNNMNQAANEPQWKGNWFPHNPTTTTSHLPKTSTTSTQYKDTLSIITTNDDDAAGGDDNDDIYNSGSNISSESEQQHHQQDENDCDNGRNTKIDYGPSNVEELYSCIEKKNLFEPNITISPLRNHNNIPHFYQSSEVCINETIEYDEIIPTFGSYRPLWAKYGEYIYLPVQRWMHNLKNGGLVMLYHPCANKLQVENLKNIIKNCLYRYIITPSIRLTRERPMALVVWSKSLEFSVIHEQLIKDFIQNEALHAPENISTNGKYKELLIKPAKYVTDKYDQKLCPSPSE